jgi:hypothetical protein
MEVGFKISHARIGQLLMYARALPILSTAVDKISEWRFRRYWQQYADTDGLRSMRGKDQAESRAEYERRVFHQIVQLIGTGTGPRQEPRRQVFRSAELDHSREVCGFTPHRGFGPGAWGGERAGVVPLMMALGRFSSRR